MEATVSAGTDTDDVGNSLVVSVDAVLPGGAVAVVVASPDVAQAAIPTRTASSREFRRVEATA